MLSVIVASLMLFRRLTKEAQDMAADLTLLEPGFRAKIDQLIAHCAAIGCEMRPSTGLRDPFEQGRLWRQSRSIEEIRAKLAQLRAAGAPFLAECIDSVGPQSGGRVTNAIPGLSWHQWGQALDCFWLVDGKAEWSTRKVINGHNGYQVLADEAERLGLTAGGHWSSLKDWPHVQLDRASSPLSGGRKLAQIDAEMAARFPRR
jgi:D-alanyl-D-alanine carboxypeptidase.